MQSKFGDSQFLLKDRRHGLIDGQSGDVIPKNEWFEPEADIQCALSPNRVKEESERQAGNRGPYPH